MQNLSLERLTSIAHGKLPRRRAPDEITNRSLLVQFDQSIKRSIQTDEVEIRFTIIRLSSVVNIGLCQEQGLFISGRFYCKQLTHHGTGVIPLDCQLVRLVESFTGSGSWHIPRLGFIRVRSCLSQKRRYRIQRDNCWCSLFLSNPDRNSRFGMRGEWSTGRCSLR